MTQTEKQPDLWPIRKVGYGTGAGATASVIMGLLQAFFPDQYELLPTHFERSLVILVFFVTAYLTKERKK